MACILACAAGAAQSDDEAPAIPYNHWRLVASPYTQHFKYSPDHRNVWALGIERQQEAGWLVGATYFRNSFGQPSSYLYAGRRHEDLFGHDQLFGQWSAGLLYGYRGKYLTKVPFNHNGYSPGLLFSLGWHFDPSFSVAVHLLGDSAVMLQLAYDWH